MAATSPNPGASGAPAPDVQCAHCKMPIVDPTTQVVHGTMTYCCANCAAAMEQSGPGSDPDSGTGKNHLRCAHCGAPIVNEATMESRGDQAFCCPNCARHVAPDGQTVYAASGASAPQQR